MKKLILSLILAALLLFSACGANGETYSSLNLKFSVSCPAGWTAQEDSVSATFFAPSQGEGDVFDENVSYGGAASFEELGISSLAEYAEALRAILKGSMTDYAELECVNERIAGMDAVKLTYRFTSSQVTGELEQRMYMLADSKNIYAIVYTANTETFPQYVSGADAIAASFKAK